jgi:hypothetical protein
LLNRGGKNQEAEFTARSFFSSPLCFKRILKLLPDSYDGPLKFLKKATVCNVRKILFYTDIPISQLE